VTYKLFHFSLNQQPATSRRQAPEEEGKNITNRNKQVEMLMIINASTKSNHLISSRNYYPIVKYQYMKSLA
jgi:hypothetical protein